MQKHFKQTRGDISVDWNGKKPLLHCTFFIRIRGKLNCYLIKGFGNGWIARLANPDLKIMVAF